jgi:dihydroorotase
LALFDNKIALKDKKITAEVCIHHLWFDKSNYTEKGTLIKWNPAIKSESDKTALFKALLNNTLDVIATDHAPHTLEEKNNSYLKAPSGGPLVQHALPAMLEFVKSGKISIEKVIEKMCHNPAICFKLEDRGFVREGYFADLVLVDLNNPWHVNKKNIFYKCKWSPFEGTVFNSKITHTLVNGHIAYENGHFNEDKKGMRLSFDR